MKKTAFFFDAVHQKIIQNVSKLNLNMIFFQKILKKYEHRVSYFVVFYNEAIPAGGIAIELAVFPKHELL